MSFSFQMPDYQGGSGESQNVGGPLDYGGDYMYSGGGPAPQGSNAPFGASASQSFLAGAGAAGGTSGHHSRYEDLKMMLESNKDNLKLEAMKRIITMIAKGRGGDGPRELFAHVVKSVVTKNPELKKLVYLYLTRYAEQEQDLALLSISSFQRSLKDPNPLIRASALRVLTSIRVSMIAPIMYIAIRDSANDMSPYVRKTAAHAIPKLYSIEPEMKGEIIDIIERLLQDKTSLVLASAVYAFEEVCPDRIDLIHQNYRKFCALLADFDEWGQIILINLLMRYARTQFTDPNTSLKQQSKDEDDDFTDASLLLDPDLRLLLRSARPLLSSRNSAVVLSVIQLYMNLAPKSEINSNLIKPLIRLLHSHREIQLMVLSNIVTMTSDHPKSNSVPPSQTNSQPAQSEEQATDSREGYEDPNTEANREENGGDIVLQPNGINGQTEVNGVKNQEKEKEDDDDDEFYASKAESGDGQKNPIKSLFEPHLKSFFIKAKDSSHVKILKLQILTNLSNSSNIPLILREFQAYIQNYQEDVDFVSAVIHSIGVCASRIHEVAHICLNGLISLLSNRNEVIVSQSIVVIRTQIVARETERQQQSKDQEDGTDERNSSSSTVSLIIKQITRLLDNISTPQARATILWILAEFCDRNNRALNESPDVLRKVAKNFHQEGDLVKLQALNLAAKLYVTLSTKYGFNRGDVQSNNSDTASNNSSTPVIENGEAGQGDVKDTSQPSDQHQQSDINSVPINQVVDEQKVRALINYLFNLAKYDLNYDVRDRGRFLKQLISQPNLQLAKKILMAPKKIESGSQFGVNPSSSATGFIRYIPDARSAQYRFGSLSHYLGRRIKGYEDLPDFPVVQPDSSVRNKPLAAHEMILETADPFEPIKSGASERRKQSSKVTTKKIRGFYSDSSEEEEESEDEESSLTEEATESEEESSEEDSEDEASDEEDDEEEEDDDSESEDDEEDETSEEEEKIDDKTKIQKK